MIERRKIFWSFVAFGFINNVLYVVILSAAVDLVGARTPKAVVLLADIVPAFLLKLVSPFFIHLIPYEARLFALVGLSTLGMLLISLSGAAAIGAKIFGITLASLSSGLGELTFLQLTYFFHEVSSVGGFASGTGVAGLGGSFLFMLLTNVAQLPVWIALLLFAVAPSGFLAVYYGLLPSPPQDVATYQPLAEEPLKIGNLQDHIKDTVSKIVPLLRPYMVPLCTVYICEYVINQGIAPTLLFPLADLPSWLFSSYRDIYVVYGFLYQLGVFVSRTSINFNVRFRNLYVFSLLQFLNVAVLLIQSVYFWPFGSIWPLLVVIFYEGLLGGFSYANTFLSVSEDSPKPRREFNMGCVGMSDSFGIAVAGLISYGLELKLCDLQVRSGRGWCRGET